MKLHLGQTWRQNWLRSFRMTDLMAHLFSSKRTWDYNCWGYFFKLLMLESKYVIIYPYFACETKSLLYFSIDFLIRLSLQLCGYALFEDLVNVIDHLSKKWLRVYSWIQFHWLTVHIELFMATSLSLLFWPFFHLFLP